MTEANANGTPLDLRALGDVESPEVVRQALRRFRRRVALRGIWVVAAVAILIGLRVAGPFKTTLSDRIQRGAGVQVGAVYRAGDATVILQRVADLGRDTTGLEFVVADPTLPESDYVSLESAAPLEAADYRGEGRATTASFELHVPASGRMSFAVIRSDCPPAGGTCALRRLGLVVVDLPQLGVDSIYWK